MQWPTAQSVVQQAALELGLIQFAGDLGDNAYASSDSNIAQLLALLNKAGADLVDEYEWQQLRAEWSITTVGNVLHPRIGAYALPPDWRGLVSQSGWNRTQRLPMGGPLSEQEWQYLSSRFTGVVWTILFRPMQGLLWLYPPTSTPPDQDITFAYKSGYWARPAELVEGTDYSAWSPDTDFNVGSLVAGEATATVNLPFLLHIYRCVLPGLSDAAGVGPDSQLTDTGQPTISGPIVDGACVWNWIGTVVQRTNGPSTLAINEPSFATKTEPTAGSDVLFFDKQLLVARLKLEWRKAKGFDTTDAERDATQAFRKATSASESAPILSLNGTGVVRDRLLGTLNIPITGFGS
jgi:hypothetical protein